MHVHICTLHMYMHGVSPKYKHNKASSQLDPASMHAGAFSARASCAMELGPKFYRPQSLLSILSI
jgi:hypothetical protein